MKWQFHTFNHQSFNKTLFIESFQLENIFKNSWSIENWISQWQKMNKWKAFLYLNVFSFFLCFPGTFLALLIFLSIAGNILVCVAIYTERSLRRIGNLFLASLAIADLFVASLVMTFAGVNDILGMSIECGWTKLNFVIDKFQLNVAITQNLINFTQDLSNSCLSFRSQASAVYFIHDKFMTFIDFPPGFILCFFFTMLCITSSNRK